MTSLTTVIFNIIKDNHPILMDDVKIQLNKFGYNFTETEFRDLLLGLLNSDLIEFSGNKLILYR